MVNDRYRAYSTWRDEPGELVAALLRMARVATCGYARWWPERFGPELVARCESTPFSVPYGELVGYAAALGLSRKDLAKPLKAARRLLLMADEQDGQRRALWLAQAWSGLMDRDVAASLGVDEDLLDDLPDPMYGPALRAMDPKGWLVDAATMRYLTAGAGGPGC